VNGAAVPNSGAAVSIGNGLSVSSTGGTTLSVGGTPTTATAVTLTVSVVDGASDSAGPDTYTINVSSPPSGSNNGNLNGRYVCEANGFSDSDGTRWGSLSSFQANGSGAFTGGVFDTNGADFNVPMTGTLTGTYSIGPDNNGIVTFTSVPTSGPAVTGKWAIALTNAVEPAQEFRMVEIDDLGASPSGRNGQADCYLATTSAFAASTINGKGFVFESTGEGGINSPRNAVGRFSASGGIITSGIFDQATGIPTTYSSTALGGSYTTPDSTTGRYTFIFTAGSGSAHYTAYTVDSDRMFMLETDAGSGLYGARIHTQHQSSYSAANLNGSLVLYAQGFNYTGTSASYFYSWIAQGTGNGTGNLTFNESYNDAGGNFVVGTESGTVTPTFDAANPGRVTVNPGGGTDMLYLYLYDNNAGFELNVNPKTGSGNVDGGFFDAQTQTTFTDAAVAGTYLLGQFPPVKPKDVSVGEVDVAGSGSITADISDGGPSDFTWDQSQSGLSYTWLANNYGVLSVTGGSTDSTCIVISTTKFACIANTKAIPQVQIFQH